MSVIRTIYEKEPGFPATDQHPAAVRYKVGAVWVDAIGGAPTQGEVDAVLSPVDAKAGLKTKLADETITHEELVKLLKGRI